MAKSFSITQEEIEAGKLLIKNHTNEREYRRGIIIVLLSDNHYTAKEIAERLGISVQTVFNDIDRIRKPFIKKQRSNWGGRRHALMTHEEESAFLEQFEQESLERSIVSIPKLHAEFNNTVGKIVSKSTIYRMLERHGWQKIKPDTKHPADPEIKNELKKTRSKFLWMKHP